MRQTLEDLDTQSFSDFDVWVVDQNDVPIPRLDEHLKRKKLHHVAMPPLGSHAGRNRAIFHTAAKLCIFVDDDVRLAPNFVELHVQRHSELDKSVAAICGRVVQPKDGYTEEQMQAMARLARYHGWRGTVSGNFVGTFKGYIDHLHECNFSAKTDILRNVGGFNEEFRGNAYFEGAELALRIQKAGYKLFYDGSISLTHLQEGSGGNREKDKAKHTYWFMRNYSLLNSLFMTRASIPLFELYGVSYVLAKALKNRNPSIAVEGLRGLKDGLRFFSPQAIRYRRTGDKS